MGLSDVNTRDVAAELGLLEEGGWAVRVSEVENVRSEDEGEESKEGR